MATLDYIDVPLGATQLRNSSDAQHDIRPVPKITTSIPHPSPPPSPSTSRIRRPSQLSSTATSLSSPTLSFIPQLLLSASLPPTSPSPASTTPTLPNPRKKSEPENVVLLSSGDPLSLPIMSTNFKRFVSIIGPVFWLQDRIEEIVLWKRGWMQTAVWMAAYSLLCFYPRVILLLPHIILIGVILATYPYHTVSSGAPLYTIEGDSEALPSTPVAEGSVPWQANIQGIQNLMGAVADAHALIEPYIHHLILTPQHLSPTRPRNTPSPPQQPPSRFPYSPYTPHILTLLTLSFPLLLFIIHLPIFPIRETCLFIGLFPFFLTHPRIRPILPLAGPLLLDSIPVLIKHYHKLRNRTLTFLHLKNESESKTQKQLHILTHEYLIKEPPVPLRMTLQRVMDDDRLTDECWNSEMRQVQLWENERFGGPLPPPNSPTGTMMFVSSAFAASASASSIPISMPGSGSGSGSGSGANLGSGPGGGGSGAGGAGGGVQPMQKKGWSKANLRHGERSGWTRGRDGWSGVGGGGAIGGADAVEGGGEVSSNLTFSLAPGWRFVETEDWRKDLQCAWSGCGGDLDGWVYTNDAWIGPRPAPYTSGGGSVTRRRRWVRRVWYDPRKAAEDS